MSKAIAIGSTIQLREHVAAIIICAAGRENNMTAKVVALTGDGGVKTDVDLGGLRYWDISDVEVAMAPA